MYLPVLLIAGCLIFLAILLHYIPFILWLSAKVSGVHISLVQLGRHRIGTPGRRRTCRGAGDHPSARGARSTLSSRWTCCKGSTRPRIGIKSQY